MKGPRCIQPRGQAGYSLPEMITVVAIIGVLALVTIPSFMTYYQSSKVKASMRNLTTDLRKMRALAITRGVQTRLSYATGGSARKYKLYYGSSGSPTATQTWKLLSVGNMGADTKTLDSIVNFPANSVTTPQTFTDVDGDGQIDVIFLPSGGVSIPTANPALQFGSITIKTPLNKVSVQQYQIDISPVGRVLAH